MKAKDRVLSLLNVYARIAKGAENTEEEQLWHELIDYEQNKFNNPIQPSNNLKSK